MKIVPISNHHPSTHNNNNKIQNNKLSKYIGGSPIRQFNNHRHDSMTDDDGYISVGKVRQNGDDYGQNNNSGNKSKLKQSKHCPMQVRPASRVDSADEMSFGSLVQSSSSMPSFYSAKPQRSSAVSLKHTKLRKRDSAVSQSTDFVLDSRNDNSASWANRCKGLPIARVLTFILMYQVVAGFCALVAVREEQLWVLAAIAALVFPTYYSCKCIYSHAQPTSQFASKSMKHTRISNSYHADNSTQPHFQHHEQSNSQLFSSQHHEQTSRYLLVVPYLHNNQVQSFSKCKHCPSTHVNTRIKHCHRCQVCHLGYDHYCRWLTLCVDAYNYAYFLKFLISVWVIGLAILVAAVYQQVAQGLFLRQFPNKTIAFLIIAMIIIIEVLLSWLFCTYVLVYHIWLARRGVSTRQHFSNRTTNCNNSLFCKSLQNPYPSYYAHLFTSQIGVSSQGGQLYESTMLREQIRDIVSIGNASAVKSNIKSAITYEKGQDRDGQDKSQGQDQDELTQYEQDQYNKMGQSIQSIGFFEPAPKPDHHRNQNNAEEQQKSEMDCSPPQSPYYDRKSHKSNSKNNQKQRPVVTVTRILQSSATLHRQQQKYAVKELSASMTDKSQKFEQQHEDDKEDGDDEEAKTEYNRDNASEIQSLSASMEIIPSGRACKFIYKEEKDGEEMLADDESQVESPSKLSKLSHRNQKPEQV